MTRVLVTGASGFIGRHTVPLLVQRGHEVHVVGRSAPRGGDGVQFHAVDLLDGPAVGALVSEVAAESLLHLAWDATPGAFWSSPLNVDWVAATLQLVRAFAEAGGRRVLGAGSCAEYESADGVYSEDTTPLRPSTLYGAAKTSLHLVLSRAAPVIGVQVAWARIFLLHGPGEPASKLVGSLVGSLLRGEEAWCRHPSLVRDFLDVREVASALVAVLDSEVTGPVNVGSGEPVRLGEVATVLGRLTERAELVRLGSGRLPEGEPPTMVADVRRLRRQVGWVPSFTLQQGLQHTVEWWRAAAASRPENLR